jgi:RNA polymerase sigma-70 factor, ECF subfamily
LDTAAIDCTQLLRAWSNGDREALDQLIPVVQAELRRIARRYTRRERRGDSLQTTALVNEAYLRLIHVKNVEWKDRAHFFAISARMMRRSRRV